MLRFDNFENMSENVKTLDEKIIDFIKDLGESVDVKTSDTEVKIDIIKPVFGESLKTIELLGDIVNIVGDYPFVKKMVTDKDKYSIVLTNVKKDINPTR